MTVGLVTAMPVELRCLEQGYFELNQPFKISNNLVAIICGIGATNARRAAELLLFHRVDGLISWGTATGLSNIASPGDLLLPEVVISSDGQSLSTDNPWRDHLTGQLPSFPGKIHNGPLVETRFILDSASRKAALHEESGAIAADMESASVIKVANENRLPCLVVRTVADRHDQALPYEITRHTDVFGKPSIPDIILELLQKPRLFPQVLEIARAMQVSMASLKSVGQQGQSALSTFY